MKDEDFEKLKREEKAAEAICNSGSYTRTDYKKWLEIYTRLDEERCRRAHKDRY